VTGRASFRTRAVRDEWLTLLTEQG
jgi:hypothetical protein